MFLKSLTNNFKSRTTEGYEEDMTAKTGTVSYRLSITVKYWLSLETNGQYCTERFVDSSIYGMNQRYYRIIEELI